MQWGVSGGTWVGFVWICVDFVDVQRDCLDLVGLERLWSYSSPCNPWNPCKWWDLDGAWWDIRGPLMY